MIIEINLTQIIFLLIALVSALGAGAKLFYVQFERGQEERFKSLSEILAKDHEVTHQLEIKLMELHGDIPRTYLRRDDYMRETQTLRESIRAEIGPIRLSVNRIEDFLIKK